MRILSSKEAFRSLTTTNSPKNNQVSKISEGKSYPFAKPGIPFKANFVRIR